MPILWQQFSEMLVILDLGTRKFGKVLIMTKVTKIQNSITLQFTSLELYLQNFEPVQCTAQVQWSYRNVSQQAACQEYFKTTNLAIQILGHKTYFQCPALNSGPSQQSRLAVPLHWLAYVDGSGHHGYFWQLLGSLLDHVRGCGFCPVVFEFLLNAEEVRFFRLLWFPTDQKLAIYTEAI